ncbi:DUF2971 domain-containing protein [Enterobacter asburiae]|uniref:DUF2971 domain-containing protein n=1 Tax=Enterobacter asburiae TaxID=61645 RepID=UPI003F562CEB
MKIYHYTDLNGFKGIVESNSLWATNIYFLNDREEFHHGYKCFLNALDHIDDNYVLDGVKEQVQSMLSHFMKHQGMHIYSISFCSIPDQLSQWRGYGKNQGICIEFEENELSDVLNDGDYEMENESVIYTEENSTIEAKEEINRLISSNGPGAEDIRKDSFARGVYLQFLMKKYIPFFKHSGFKEEKEYRFVFTASQRVPDVSFRISGNGYIPYIILSPVNKAKLPIKKIIVGPTNNFEEVKAGIRFLLDYKGFANVVIEESKVPYRT